MKVALILSARLVCRLLFLALWSIAYPVGLAQAKLAAAYRGGA